MVENSGNRKNKLFSREHLKRDLKNRTVRGGLNKATTSVVSLTITMGSAVVLARLLAPEEFGMFAMVLAFTELARFILELGLGIATVQREQITHEEISTLFWINLGFGIILMAAVAALSPAIAGFYGDPRLLPVCMVLSIVFLLKGIPIQHRSLLERQMRFGYLGLINIISSLLGSCAAITIALHGYGIWALVWRELVYETTYAFGTWFLCGWIPGFPRLNVGVQSSLRIGADLLGSDFVQYITRNLDRMLIGRFSGATPLGLYSKAFQLATMPIENVQMVFWDIGFSPLSALQSDPVKYRRFYSKLLLTQSFLYMPLVIFISIQSEELIHLLFGEAWISAAPYLRIFAIMGFIKPIVGTLRLVMITCGKTRRYLWVMVTEAVCMVTAYAVGIHWGAIGVAYAYVFASYALMVWFLSYFCLKGTPISAIVIIKTISLPVMSSLGTGVILIALLPSISNNSTLVSIIISILIISAAYLLIWLCIPNGRKKLKDFWSYRTELFRKA